MVKDKPRAPHKDGCKCASCKNKVKSLEVTALVAPPVVEPAPAPPVPTEVELRSLPAAGLFEISGKRYRVANKEPECITCHELSFRNEGPLASDKMWLVVRQVSLGVLTKVKPI